MRDTDEDQAETVEYLMGSEEERQFASRVAGEDEIVSRKIQITKGNIHRRSKGLMSDQYWRDLDAGTVDEFYWSTLAKREMDLI